MRAFQIHLCLLAVLLVGGCEARTAPAPVTKIKETVPLAAASAATSEATATATASAKPPPPKPQPAAPSALAIAGSNHFGFDLYQRLREEKGNLALSPASISLALAMTYAGAKGDTAAEMAKVLGFPQDSEELHGGWASLLEAWQQTPPAPDGSAPAYEIAVANRLFGDQSYTFEAPFLALTEKRYGAPLERLVFKGKAEEQRQHINGWVKQQTRDRIVDLIPPRGLSDETRLVLTNALYFKAEWDATFDKKRTKDGPFTTADGQQVKVPMMQQTTWGRYAEVDGTQLLQLGYKGDRFAMMFVLPGKDRQLADVEQTLTGDLLDTWLADLKSERVAVALPRFKVEPPKSVELRKTLEAMGMKLAFQRLDADFTGIANPPKKEDRLYIDKIFHKAFVAVDEAGTEAAAATAVVMARAGGMPAEPKIFRADRPFLFFLRDTRSKLVLFIGRVTNPKPKA